MQVQQHEYKNLDDSPPATYDYNVNLPTIFLFRQDINIDCWSLHRLAEHLIRSYEI